MKDLLDNQTLFESFANAAEISIIIIDRNQIVRYWNKHAYNMFGYTKEEAIGQSVAKLIIPDNVMSNEKHQSYITKFFSGRPSRTFGNEATLKAKTKSNSIVPVEITVFKIEQDEETLVGGIIRNVSDKAKSIQELKEKNDKINKILGKLEESNEQLTNEKDRVKFELSRAQTQDKLALSMLFSIVAIVTVVIGTSTFTRIQESVVNFSKDAALLLIGNLGGAVSALYGIRKIDESKSSTPNENKKSSKNTEQNSN